MNQNRIFILCLCVLSFLTKLGASHERINRDLHFGKESTYTHQAKISPPELRLSTPKRVPLLKEEKARPIDITKDGFVADPSLKAALDKILKEGFSAATILQPETPLLFRSDLKSISISILKLLTLTLNILTDKFKNVEMALTNGSSQKFNILLPMLIEKVKKGNIHTLSYTPDPGSIYRATSLRMFTQAVTTGQLRGEQASESPTGEITFYLRSSQKESLPSSFTAESAEQIVPMLRDFIESSSEATETSEEQHIIFSDEVYDISPHNTGEVASFHQEEGEDISALDWIRSYSNVGDLKVLDFCFSSLNDEDFSKIASEDWDRFKNLAVIDLSVTQLTEDASEIFLNLLMQLKHLKFVNISRTALAEKIFEPDGLWKKLQKQYKKSLIEKIIWLPLNEKEIEPNDIPEECRGPVLQAHSLYAELIMAINRAQERQEIDHQRDDILRKYL